MRLWTCRATLVCSVLLFLPSFTLDLFSDMSGPLARTGDKETGALHGRVLLQGSALSPRAPGRVKPSESKACGHEVKDRSILVGDDGAVENVIVYLEGVDGKRTRTTIRMTNRKCHFEPRVQTATVGSTLIVSNDDDILHNTHAYLGESRTLFNLGLPFKGIEIPRPMREPGMVTFRCDAGHTWMRGFLLVLEHDYHTVSDAHGHFRLSSVPSGSYRMKAWHERLGGHSRTVEISPGTDTEIEIRFKGE